MVKNKRKLIEKLYTGVCSIYQYEEVKGPYSSTHKETLVYDRLPCRISFSVRQSSYTGVRGSEEKELANRSKQLIKLFISPDYNILPGSKIVVEQNGRKTVYKNSSQPAVFSDHQEILMDVYDKWI